MRICVICHLFPTNEGKGGYFFVEQLVNEFVKSGHCVTVIAPVNVASKYGVHKPYGPKHETRDVGSGKVYEIYRPRYYGRDIRLKGVSWARRECRKSIERTFKKLNVAYDAIYCHFYESGALVYKFAKKNSIPLFIASGESQIPTIINSSKDFSLEEFRKYVTGVICVSTKNKDESISKGYADANKCLVIPNGVDLQMFYPLDKSVCRKELGYDETVFIATCIGNFSERKGQERIVKAVGRINERNIRLILGGQGYISHKPESILHCGFIAHNQIPKYLSASDIYIIPTRWEGCCNSIIEAMACGLPIISSNRPFNWDVLNNDNSILIDPDNIEEIAQAIEILYRDDELRGRLGKNAFSTAQDLSIKRRAERIIDFIRTRIQQDAENRTA